MLTTTNKQPGIFVARPHVKLRYAVVSAYIKPPKRIIELTFRCIVISF